MSNLKRLLFQIPKPNLNWHRLMSVIVLFTMTFLLIQPAFTWHCLGEYTSVTASTVAVKLAQIGVADAHLQVAIAEGPIELGVATAYLVAMKDILKEAKAQLTADKLALEKCRKGH